MRLHLTAWWCPRAIAVIFLALMAPAAPAEPPPPELFYREVDLVDATLSPSGRKLVVRSKFGGTRIGLGVVDLAPGGKLTRPAHFTDVDVWETHWVNDERLLFSVVDLSEGSGRPNGAPGLFAVNPDGSAPRQLVHRRGTPVVGTIGMPQRVLPWNHRLLRVPAPQAGEPNEEVLLTEFTLDERRLQRPLWVNTRTGRTRSVDVPIPHDTVGWLADSRGELRVAYTRKGGRVAALTRQPGSETWTPVYESAYMQQPFSIVGIDRAGTLYVTYPHGKAGELVLSIYNTERRAPAAPLVSTPGFDFNGQVLLGSDGEVLGVRVLADAETTVWQNATMKALQQEADALMPGHVNRIDCRRCGRPDMVALVRSYSDREPGVLWLFQAQPPEGEARWRLIGRVRKDVDARQMASTALHRISARDGRDLPVWVTTPPGASGPHPAVVLVHGGPWVRGRDWRWSSDAQFLASRGYVVIEPEFRGSTGYGRAHLEAGFKQWGQAMQDDVADALLWAQKRQIASDKACIAGASYGGYSTLMGLIRHPELYRCGVAWVAVTDLDLLLSGSWWVRDDIGDLGRQYELRDMVGDVDKDAEMLAANSPVRQAARIKAPLLLAFGEQDLRVPLAHGKRLREALRDAGNTPEWVSYPGEGHSFGMLASHVDLARRMERFLATHLRDAPAD